LNSKHIVKPGLLTKTQRPFDGPTLTSKVSFCIKDTPNRQTFDIEES
jgi:hypothetical protein